MGRQQKNNADYFSHDNDMRNDEKVKAVRRRFKHEGYSVWNMILEKLCKSDGFTLDYCDINIELWAGDFEVEPERLKEMIEYFIHIKLLLHHDSLIFSETMITRFSPLLEERKRKREYFEAEKSRKQGISDAQSAHSIVKDSIVKDTLKEDDLLMADLKIETCKLMVNSKGYQVMETAIKLYDGFRQSFPNNKDLPLTKVKDWIPPIRILIEKKDYPPERIIEVAKWAVKDEFWQTVVLDTISLEKNFEKLKLKYQHARQAQT